MTDPKPDTRGSRKALGAENARLKSKVGRLCIENNGLRDELALMTKAFELATAHGHSYQVEGWGGRWKTRTVSAAEYRELLMSRAKDALTPNPEEDYGPHT